MDVHNSEKKLQRMIENIKNSTEISKENKEHILGFELGKQQMAKLDKT
jgi:hypothetical protein